MSLNARPKSIVATTAVAIVLLGLLFFLCSSINSATASSFSRPPSFMMPSQQEIRRMVSDVIADTNSAYGYTPRSSSSSVGISQCPIHPEPLPLPSVLPPDLSVGAEISWEIVSVLMKLTNTTASSVGILYDGKIIFGKGFDFQNKSDPAGQAPIDLDTPYRIGSLSKVFTDVMMMMLKDQKGLNIDDPVQKYWPNFNPKSPFPPADKITFRHLATQLSGMPMISPCNYLEGACNITTDQAFANLDAKVEAILPTDYYPHYSDGAFAILGRALEKIAGMSWEQFLTQNLLEVHTMNNTGWDFPPQVTAKMAMPLLNGELPSVVAFDDMDWARPTGGMHSSVNDLAPFVQMFLDGYNSIDSSSGRIKTSTLREMLLPRYINDDVSTGFGFPFEWYYSKETELWYITKGGFFPGYTAMMLMVPKLNFGVIALTNNYAGVFLAEAVATSFLPHLTDYLNKHAPPAPNPGNLTAYVGQYVSQYPPIPEVLIYNQIVLSEDKSYIAQVVSSTTYPLRWMGGNTFRIEPPTPAYDCQETQIGEVYEYIQFQIDNSTNQVVSYVMPGSDPYWGVTWVKT